MKTPYAKLAKIYTKYFGHMTKMATIYGINPLKIFYRASLLPNAFKWDFFEKVDFLNTVEAKVIILT